MPDAFTRAFGSFSQDFSTGDSLGRPLANQCWREGSNSAWSTLSGSSTIFRSPNPYLQKIINITQPELSLNPILGSVNVGGETSGTHHLANFDGTFDFTDPVWSSDLINRASVQAALKMAGNKAHLGTALAESKDAIRLLSSSTLSIFRAVLAAKSGNFIGAAKALGISWKGIRNGKELSKRWLELQYGWLPLISDVHDVYRLTQSTLVDKAYLLKSQSTTREVRRVDEERSGGFITTFVISEFHKVVFWARVKDSRLRTAAQLDLVNPLSIAWEVVPFSFIIDWFVPVGNVLEASSSFDGLDPIGGSLSSVMDGKSNTEHDTYGGLVLVDKYCFRRVPWGFDPSEYRFYRTKSPFSSRRSANALALWRLLVK